LQTGNTRLTSQHDFDAFVAQAFDARKGCCYDNACAESFFHTLKVERIHGERFYKRTSMRRAVFEYIEVDYNRTRRHSNNGMISQDRFAALQVA